MYEQDWQGQQVPDDHMQIQPVYWSDEDNYLWPEGVHEYPPGSKQLVIQGTPGDPHSQYVDPNNVTWHESALVALGIQQPAQQRPQQYRPPRQVRQRQLSTWQKMGKYYPMTRRAIKLAIIASPIEAVAEFIPGIDVGEDVGLFGLAMAGMYAYLRARKK